MSPENEAELQHSVNVANCAAAIVKAVDNCDPLMIAKGVATMASVTVSAEDQSKKTALALFLLDLAIELDPDVVDARWQ